ncbi:hypothetical protein FACS1894186_6560 [Alphaproteobacteria bacterium]|nr:hypothetical protein FACS1894186_6560 [Alphaproteobacteria bacterium]
MIETLNSYQVLALEGSEWELRARFASDEKTAAVREAMRIEESEGRPVRVFHEAYNTRTEEGSQNLVYASAEADTGKRPRRKPQSGESATYRKLKGSIYRARAAGRWSSGGGAEAAVRERAGAAPPSMMHAFFRIVLVLMIATAIAAIFTLGADILLPMLGIGIDGRVKSAASVGLFVFLMAVVGIPALIAYVPWAAFDYEGEKDYGRGEYGGASGAALAPAGPGLSERFVSAMLDWLAPKAPAEAPKPEPLPVAVEVAASIQADAAPAAKEDEEILVPEEGDSEAAHVEEALRAEAAALRAAEAAARSQGASEAEAKRLMARVLHRLIGKIDRRYAELTPAARTWISLSLTGASDRLGQDFSLSAEQERRMLADMLTLIYPDKKELARFVDNMGGYASDLKYLNAINAGMLCAEKLRAGDENPTHDALDESLDLWDAGQKMAGGAGIGAAAAAPEQQKLMAIMFTDIVGSTKIFEEYGDWAAKTLLDAHNRIVRSSLTAFGGQEIKHTGDGIVATFSSVVDALGAAAKNRTDIAAYNATSPTIALRITTGINAGEPDRESGDIFGITVNTAARLCEIASPDEICCSEVVRWLAMGKPFLLIDKGFKEVQGVKEPIRVFALG